MKRFSPKNAHRVVASILAGTMCCALIPFSAFASDGVSELLHVDGNNLYANGQPLTIADAPNGQDSMLYVGDTLVRELTIAGDSNGSDGYNLSDVTIFAGSQHAIDPSATTASITVAGGNVGTIYAGGEAILNTDVAQALADMEAALEAALADVGLLGDALSDETEATLENVLANLAAILAEFEDDYTATGTTLESMLASLDTLAAAIEAEIAPYILAESESYLGAVGASLLHAVEDALLGYVDALEARLMEKAEDVLIATVIDALVILFAADADMTEDELDVYITAIENLMDSGLIDTISDYTAAQTALEVAQAAYTVAQDAYDSQMANAPALSDYYQGSEPVAPTKPVLSDTWAMAFATFAADLTDAEILAVAKAQSKTVSLGFWSTTYTLNTGNLNYDAVRNLLSGAGLTEGLSLTAITALFSDLSSIYTYDASVATAAAEFSMLCSMIYDLYSDISDKMADNTYMDEDAYNEAVAAYEEALVQYAQEKEAYEQAYATYEAALAAWKTANNIAFYETALASAQNAYNAASDAASSAETALYTALYNNIDDATTVLGLLGVDISLTDLVSAALNGELSAYLSDIVDRVSDSLTLVYFITDVAALLTGDMEDLSDVTGIISSIYALMEEYGLNDTFEGILSAALENLTDEFNAEYLVDEFDALNDAMVGALEAAANNLSAAGYPTELETQLEAMLEEVYSILVATGTDQDVLDAVHALLAELATTEGALDAIIADIFAEISANALLAKLTADEIEKIIVDVLTEQLAVIMGVEVVVLSEATITVTSGSVGTIYASGAGAGYLVSGVTVSVSGGSIGEIVNSMPTTADEAAAALAHTLPAAICDAISDAVTTALADFTAPVITLTGGTYTIAPDAAYIPFGYTLSEALDGTFCILDTTLEDANDLLANLDDLLDIAPEDFTAEQLEDLLTVIETLASLEKETLASNEATVEKLNALDALFLAAVNESNNNGTLAVNAIVAADAINAVTVEGLASAVYGNPSVALPDVDTTVTLSLAVAQIEIDTDADVLAELDEATLATVFAFSAKPSLTTTTTGSSSTTPIENDDIYSPITFSVYLSDSFPDSANYVTVVHYFSSDSAQTDAYEILTCKVLTDANGARYIKITVTEFSNFTVIPVYNVEDENDNDNSDNGSSNNGNNGSSNSSGNSSSTDIYYAESAPDTVTTQTATSTTTSTSGTTDTTDTAGTADAANTTVTTTPATDESTPADSTTPDASIEDALVAVPSTASGVSNVVLGLVAVLALAGALTFVVLKRRSQQAED